MNFHNYVLVEKGVGHGHLGPKQPQQFSQFCKNCGGILST